MDISTLYRRFISELKNNYTEGEASAITAMVFAQLASVSKEMILTNGKQQLSAVIVAGLETALGQLQSHVPVQYVLGQTSFYNIFFKVSPAVLIPRPETEELVSAVIYHINHSSVSTAIDIGTGSGCIPVSIKINCPQVTITAIDISDEALAIAKENASLNKVDLSLQQINFLDEKEWMHLGVFDIIISNPPYIPEKEKHTLDQNVTAYEPSLALFVPDNDPLIFYNMISRFASQHLASQGKIFVEVHESYAKEVATLFENAGYKTNILKDFFEKDRIVTAIRYQ